MTAHKLKIRAICGQRWHRATTHSAGVKPVTCPPNVNIDLQDLTDADLLYLNLHGHHNSPILYGQGENGHQPLAISLASFENIKRKGLHFQGTIVFGEVCYLAANTVGNRRLVNAFLCNGCRAVVAPTGQAYGHVKPVRLLDGEADRLAYFFRWGLRVYPNRPAEALDFAKRVLRFFSIPLDREDQQTLKQFVVLSRRQTT